MKWGKLEMPLTLWQNCQIKKLELLAEGGHPQFSYWEISLLQFFKGSYLFSANDWKEAYD